MSSRDPEFVVCHKPNDVSTQIRVQKIGNGFVVKSGRKPFFYGTIEETAEAIVHGLLQADWDGTGSTSTTTPTARKSK